MLVWRLEAEVNNGTVDQFLSNSAGDKFGDTLSALHEIGATTTASKLEEVAAWFPQGQPATDRRLRNDQLTELELKYPDFEQRVRKATRELSESWPQIHRALVDFLKQHAADIR